MLFVWITLVLLIVVSDIVIFVVVFVNVVIVFLLVVADHIVLSCSQ